jgi:hypothetical protein
MTWKNNLVKCLGISSTSYTLCISPLFELLSSLSQLREREYTLNQNLGHALEIAALIWSRVEIATASALLAKSASLPA